MYNIDTDGKGELIMERLRYLTDYYDEPIRRIKELGAPLNFIFVSDQHHMFRYSTVEAVESMQYILDRCPEITCVVSGGDIGNDYDPDPASFRKTMHDMMNALYGLSVPVHCCIGNHDDYIGNCIDHGWDTRNGILPDEMHALCMKYNPTPENYYYTDLDIGEGYRFVFLNTSDKPYLRDDSGQYPLAGWRLEISDRQAAWFENEALNTTRRILVFSHSPIRNKGIVGSEGAPDCIKPYDDLRNGGRVYYHLKNCRNVIAHLAGHVHYDNVYYDDDLPIVTTFSAYRGRWTQTCIPRQMGTYTETSFDVVSIKDSAMYLTRFGAGADRAVELLRTVPTVWSKTYIY